MNMNPNARDITSIGASENDGMTTWKATKTGDRRYDRYFSIESASYTGEELSNPLMILMGGNRVERYGVLIERFSAINCS